MKYLFNVILFLICLIVSPIGGKNQDKDFYPDKDKIVNYAALENPFRMQKINLVWEKARLKLGLAEKKLAKLYIDLKMQDKEELTLKRHQAEGGDKDGLREADIRARFNLILNTYGMGGKAEQTVNTAKPKELFKDKKLQKLWEKAEKTGMSSEEMLTLQQEFQHHQEKVDEYNRLMEMAGKDSRLNDNTVHRDNEDYDIRNTNEVKKKYRNVKDGYDRLHRLATNKGETTGFKEPKVAGLWRIAKEADFDDDELESLKEELGHYEKRLEKLRYLQNELELVHERHGGKYGVGDNEDDKAEGIIDRKLAKNKDAVENLHSNLERKILARHYEL